MASIQRVTSPLTRKVSYRVQVRLKGHPTQSDVFPNRREAEQWASSIESAIREGRHFPHARAQRTTFAGLAERYRESVLRDANSSKKTNGEQHIAWWTDQFGTLTLAEITPDRIAEARDALAAETFTRGKAQESTHESLNT